jgi:hypothetical protein
MTMTPDEYIGGDSLARAVFERVRELAAASGTVEVRATKSQIAFRRRRGFAFVWIPERYLGAGAAGVVVVSLALGRRTPSPRWKEVTQVGPHQWMHHLEVRDAAELDDEVVAWLAEAADCAGGSPAPRRADAADGGR